MNVLFELIITLHLGSSMERLQRVVSKSSFLQFLCDTAFFDLKRICAGDLDDEQEQEAKRTNVIWRLAA